MPEWVTWESIYFVSSCILSLCGVVAFLGNMVTPFAFFDFVDSVYLVAFGILGLSLDSPYRYPFFDIVRSAMYRHFAFSVKVVGRGLWLIFMSSIVHRSLWDNDVWTVGAIVFSLVLLSIGICSASWGCALTRRVGKSKLALLAREDCQTIFAANARVSPSMGLKAEELAKLLATVDQSPYSQSEVQAIHNALKLNGSSIDGHVTSKHFQAWIDAKYPLFV